MTDAQKEILLKIRMDDKIRLDKSDWSLECPAFPIQWDRDHVKSVYSDLNNGRTVYYDNTETKLTDSLKKKLSNKLNARYY